MPLPLPLSFWFKSPSSLIRTMAIAFLLMSLSLLLPRTLFMEGRVILLKSKSAQLLLCSKLFTGFLFLEKMPRLLLLPRWPHMIWLQIAMVASSPATLPSCTLGPATLVSVLYLEHTSSHGHGSCCLFCLVCSSLRCPLGLCFHLPQVLLGCLLLSR